MVMDSGKCDVFEVSPEYWSLQILLKLLLFFWCCCCLIYGSVWKGQLYIFLSFLLVFLFIFFSFSRYLYFYSYIFIWLYIFTFSDALWETVRMIISYNRIREHTKYIFLTRLSLCSCSFLGEILSKKSWFSFYWFSTFYNPTELM